MPSLITHCLYGDKTVLNSSSDYLEKIIRKNKQAFYVGCQGPDFFLFFHRLPIYKSNEPLFDYGLLLHHDKINELFESLLKQAKESMDDIAIAYCAGFVCHHCLDSMVHPYVYYRTDHLGKYEHMYFEAQMDHDILCANKLTQKEYISYKLIQCDSKTRNVITKMLKKLLLDLYRVECKGNLIKGVFNEMVLIERILYDPSGNKQNLFAKIERKLNCAGFATSMMIPTDYNDTWDVLNQRRDTWFNPTDDKTPLNYDFDQMAQNAISVGVNLLDKIDGYLNNRNSLDEIIEQIDGRDYEVNRPVGTPRIIFKESG